MQEMFLSRSCNKDLRLFWIPCDLLAELLWSLPVWKWLSRLLIQVGMKNLLEEQELVILEGMTFTLTATLACGEWSMLSLSHLA